MEKFHILGRHCWLVQQCERKALWLGWHQPLSGVDVADLWAVF